MRTISNKGKLSMLIIKSLSLPRIFGQIIGRLAVKMSQEWARSMTSKLAGAQFINKIASQKIIRCPKQADHP